MKCSLDFSVLNFIGVFLAIYTAAIEMLSGKDAGRVSRKPEIVADAAYAIFCRDAKTFTGNFAVDDDILKEEGITNLDQYAVDPCKGIRHTVVCGAHFGIF